MIVFKICMFLVVKIQMWKVEETKTRKLTGVPHMQQNGFKVHMLYLYVLNRGGYGKGNIGDFLSSTLSQLSI